MWSANLLQDDGKVCPDLQDGFVQGVIGSRNQCDESSSFTNANQKNVMTAIAGAFEAGDTWAWAATESKSRHDLSAAALVNAGLHSWTIHSGA